eukprot:Hpha_TRINITY_DN908_c0_g1::TRINITY_DN908_c0_g1_i1::g.156353::m.156353
MVPQGSANDPWMSAADFLHHGHTSPGPGAGARLRVPAPELHPAPRGRQHKKAALGNEGMPRWEERLSEHHLSVATQEQRRALAVAESKPLEPLKVTNANILPPNANSQAATAVATMVYHHQSYTGQMRPASRPPSKSPGRARPPWRDLTAEDRGWRQLSDWHQHPGAVRKSRRHTTPTRSRGG